jgi:hypothetical protein
MDAGPTEALNGQLMGLLIRLGDRVNLQTQDFVHEFIDHNEQGLALETLAEALAEGHAPVTDDERGELHGLAIRMQMDDFVPNAVARCPEMHN